MNIAQAQMHDRVKLPDGYWLNEERLVSPPTITRVEARYGPERVEVRALVEWTMRVPQGTDPFTDYSPRSFSEWFDLFDLEPA